MRSHEVRFSCGGQLATSIGTDGATLELADAAGSAAARELTEGDLLMAIEALGQVYAQLVGARPDSIARGLDRMLRNRTAAARERRRRAAPEPAASVREGER